MEKNNTEKTFFTWNGWLFCNTVFIDENDPENKEKPFKDCTYDLTRSMYCIEAIAGMNKAYKREWTTIRMTNIEGSFVVEVPFSVMAAMICDPEGERHSWDDEEMYKKVIRKTK